MINTNQLLLTRLSGQIDELLSSLISGRDVALLDLPYHHNMGDTLIWEGERQFIKRCARRCVYQGSIFCVNWSKIPSNAVILLHGGGNFGDLWRASAEFRLSVIERFPHQRVVVMPQSVHYKDNNLLARDIEVFLRHPDLWVCVRDRQSYDILKPFGLPHLLLVPDMALAIDPKTLEKYIQPASPRVLFLKRTDQEFQADPAYAHIQSLPLPVEVSDWPSMSNPLLPQQQRLFNLLRKRRWRFCADWYANHFFRPATIARATEFISRYAAVYTTRLHGGILAVLTGRPLFLFDNSYGKNTAVFNTWLKDAKNVWRAEFKDICPPGK